MEKNLLSTFDDFAEEINNLLTKKNIKIIFGFVGIGKHYYVENNPDTSVFIPYLNYAEDDVKLDSNIESNREFLLTILEILSNKPKLKYIFITLGKKLIAFFNKYNIQYSIVTPFAVDKENYIKNRLSKYSEEVLENIIYDWKLTNKYIMDNAIGDVYFVKTITTLSNVIYEHFETHDI
jgi:hypothetical protein